MFVGSVGTSTGTQLASRIGKRGHSRRNLWGGPADGSLSAPRRTQFSGPGMKCTAIECRHSRDIDRSHKQDAKETLRPKTPHDVWRRLPCQAQT
jgi:hypothetical protein